jgi:hypothetical protein
MSYANKGIIDELIAVEKKMDDVNIHSIIIIANSDGSGGHIHVEGDLDILAQLMVYFMKNGSGLDELIVETIKKVTK